jgi:beta-lactamase regulating signal transducer with metallopeptidase domain
MLDSIKTEKGIRKVIRVRVTPCLNPPILSGFVKPVLYLPDREIPDKDLRYVLPHELTHYQRRDGWKYSKASDHDLMLLNIRPAWHHL